MNTIINKKNLIFSFLLSIILPFLIGCSDDEEAAYPPIFEKVEVIDFTTIELTFNTEISRAGTVELRVDPNEEDIENSRIPRVREFEVSGKKLVITTDNWLVSGAYKILLGVNDAQQTVIGANGLPLTQNQRTVAFDYTAPTLLAVNNYEVAGNQQIILTFNNNLNTDLASVKENYSVFFADAELEISEVAVEENVVTISLVEEMETGTYTIKFKNLEDVNGIPTELDAGLTIEHTATERPAITGVEIDFNQIKLSFSKEMVQETVVQSSNYELVRDEEETLSLRTDVNFEDNIVTLFNGYEIVKVGNYKLTMNNLQATDGSEMAENTVYEFEHSTGPLELEADPAINGNYVQLQFNKSLEIEPVSNLDNYQVLKNGEEFTTPFETSWSNNYINFNFESLLEEGEYSIVLNNIVSTDGTVIAEDYTVNFTLNATPVVLVGDVEVTGDNSFKLFFSQQLEQSSAETIENYTFYPSSYSIASVVNGDQSVEITLNETLQVGNYYVEISENVQSVDGGSVVAGANTEFEIYPEELTAENIWGELKKVYVNFSKPLDDNSAADISNYQISFGGENVPIESAVHSENKKLEITTVDYLRQGAYTLTINNLLASDGAQIVDNTTVAFDIYVSPPYVSTEVEIVDNTINFGFSKELVQSIAEDANNYAVYNEEDNSQLQIQSVSYNNPKVEITFANNVEYGNYRIVMNNIESYDTGVVPDDYTVTFRNLPPPPEVVGDIEILDSKTLKINFSKQMDTESVENIYNYGFTYSNPDYTYENPASVANGEQSIEVSLINDMVEGVDYALEIYSLNSADGGEFPYTQFTFTYQP